MALSATLALSSATVVINKSVTATLTVSNSAASAVNMLSIRPYAYKTGDNKDDEAPVALGVVPLSSGNIISVPGLSTQTFQFQVTPQKGSGTGTYSISAIIWAQDGSTFSPASAATLTAYDIANAGTASKIYSTVTVGSATVAAASSTTVTVTLKDATNTSLKYPGTNQVNAYIVPGSGTSVGSLTTLYNNGDGTYSATYLATTAGTAVTVAATLNGFVLKSSLPTLTVTA